MKQIQNLDYMTTKRIAFALLFSLLFFYLLIPVDAFADSGVLPTNNALKVPGTSDGDSWVKKFGFIIRMGIFLVCIAAVGFGISDSIFALFRTINDARQTGEWGPAMKTITIVMAGIIFAVVLFGVLNELVFSAIDDFFKTS